MHYILITIIGLLAPSAVYASPENAQDILTPQFYEVDQKHQEFSSHFHNALLITSETTITSHTMESLEEAVQILINNKTPIMAVNLIIKNMALLKENYDNPGIIRFIEILLNQNETISAEMLYSLISQEGDQLLISNAAYLFAVFEFKRNNWKKTLKHLTGIINDLPAKDYHHALLIKGISQQRLARHRDAIDTYQLIPPSSTQYIAARLNLAISNIRQGWWTEGHNIINQVVNSSEAQLNEEAINRFYLTLGYSLIKQQYFRDARSAFRNITIDSQYSNRALLGIGLAAASQEDYSGALSVISALKEKQSYDLPSDESYLLVPYFHEKLSQSAIASAGYFEAVTYYQERIEKIEALIHANTPPKSYLNNTDFIIYVGKNPINTSPEIPRFIIDNYLTLNSYHSHLKDINDKALTIEFEQLNKKYESIITTMVNSALKQRIADLNSYMDQARYGLARLYDSSLSAN
jgi:tetratricopeptide (TPR) repeat protein